MKKLKISSSFGILIVLAFFTGFIIKVIALLGIIILHEIGHIVLCLKYKRKIDKIYIMPFGAFMKYEEDSNTFLKEEFLIAGAGIFMNFLIFIIGKIFDFPSYVMTMNQFVLCFNLLTIYPLDGGRLVEIILCKLFSFKFAVFLTSIISFITIILLLMFNLFSLNSINLLLMLGVLFFENIKYFKNKNVRFNRFLLTKYLNNNEFLKNRKLNSNSDNIFKNFFKGYNNCLFEGEQLLKKEPEILEERYGNNKK